MLQKKQRDSMAAGAMLLPMLPVPQQPAGSNVTERSTERPEHGHEGTVQFSGASRRSSGDLLRTGTRRAPSALLTINSAAFQYRRPLPIPNPANHEAAPAPRNAAPPRMLPPGCASPSRAAGGHGGRVQCWRGGSGGAGGRGRVRRRRRGEPGCPAGLRLSKRGPSSRPARLLYGNRNLSAPGLYVLQPWIVGLLLNHEQPDGKKWLTGQVLRVGIRAGERPAARHGVLVAGGVPSQRREPAVPWAASRSGLRFPKGPEEGRGQVL